MRIAEPIAGAGWRATDVTKGVPEMIPEIQFEVSFPDARKLMTVHHPKS